MFIISYFPAFVKHNIARIRNGKTANGNGVVFLAEK